MCDVIPKVLFITPSYFQIVDLSLQFKIKGCTAPIFSFDLNVSINGFIKNGDTSVSLLRSIIKLKVFSERIFFIA